ncbi:MAG: hypothetical protein ACI8P0_005865 [Planctomycetaceae bacterium]|jgi:hypothetical protein
MLNQLRLLRDVSALILIACTWRLWFAASDFPAVPFFSFLAPVSRTVDPILSGVLVVALLVDAFLAANRVARGRAFVRSVRIEQGCNVTFIEMAVALILLNQHCLQPWMYHFLILTPLLWPQTSKSKLTVDEVGSVESTDDLSDDAFSQNAILWFTASIYAWSAWSKLDAGFLQTHGPKFVGAICDAVGISTRFWTDRTWAFAAATLPIGELIVAAALLFRKTRSVALCGSVLMHLVLILAVGPWGLNHNAGVLLWNGFFIVQNVVLLVAVRQSGANAGLPSDECTTETSTTRKVRCARRRSAAVLILAGAVLFPALRSVGCCDTWPAWAVYASSPARVLVQVREDFVDQLPESLTPYVEPRQINDGWSWLRIDLWSLNATGTPIYPEDRFQLGVARSVARNFNDYGHVRIIYEYESDRWTGIRERTDVHGDAEIAESGCRFRFNSTSR